MADEEAPPSSKSSAQGMANKPGLRSRSASARVKSNRLKAASSASAVSRHSYDASSRAQQSKLKNLGYVVPLL